MNPPQSYYNLGEGYALILYVSGSLGVLPFLLQREWVMCTCRYVKRAVHILKGLASIKMATDGILDGMLGEPSKKTACKQIKTAC